MILTLGGAAVAIQLGIALVALLLARLLLKPKGGPKNIQADDQPTTLSTKGSYIPYPIGRWMIGFGFAWAGDSLAWTVEEPIEGSGGGKGNPFGGAPSASQTIWHMPAWHILCPGIVSRLISIEDNGEEVWRPTEPLTPSNTPSGSVVDAGKLGTFEIYWGEPDQPISSFLAEKIGVASRWPGVCHIVWTDGRLGNTRLWPQRKYEVERAYECVSGLSCPYMLDDGVSRGVNPAWALLTLFSAEFPDGMDRDTTQVDRVFLDDLCRVCSSEHLPMNALASDGDTADKLLQGMMADIGFVLYDNRGVLSGRVLRPPTSAVPILDDDVVQAPDLEAGINHDPDAISQVAYLFKDEDRRWRDSDVTYWGDNQAGGQNFGNPGQFQLTTPTHASVATKIAARRIQEVRGDRSTKSLKALRNASRLLPGDPFILSGVGPFRVASVQRDTMSASTTIECFLDSYAVDPVLLPDDALPDLGGGLSAAKDLAFAWMELPASVAGAEVSAISVLRIRAHGGMASARVWGSADGGDFISFGSQNYASAGGLLLSAISSSTDDVVSVLSTFEALNSDVLQVQNLSGDTASWNGGSQVLVIGAEVLYLQSVSAIPQVAWSSGHIYSVGDRVVPLGTPTGLSYVCTTAGTSGSSEPTWPRARLGTVTDGTAHWEARGHVYQLNGAIRARNGTAKVAHAIGDVAFIARASGLQMLTSPSLQPGVSLCVKTQPFSGGAGIDLSTVSAVCGTFLGSASSSTFLCTQTPDFLVTHAGDRLVAG